jgi:dihydroneopterin aldolase
VTDGITIRGLRVQARVGVTDQERALPQTVVIDLEVTADLSTAALSDDLDDTVDYSAMIDGVVEAVRSAESKLLEHLAARVVSVVSRMDGVQEVAVQIAKQPPPVAHDVEAIAVSLRRSAR